MLKERLPWSLSVMGVSLILSLVTGYGAGAVWNAEKKVRPGGLSDIICPYGGARLFGRAAALFLVAAKGFMAASLSGGRRPDTRRAGEKAWDLISHGSAGAVPRYCDVSRISSRREPASWR